MLTFEAPHLLHDLAPVPEPSLLGTCSVTMSQHSWVLYTLVPCHQVMGCLTYLPHDAAVCRRGAPLGLDMAGYPPISITWSRLCGSP